MRAIGWPCFALFLLWVSLSTTTAIAEREQQPVPEADTLPKRAIARICMRPLPRVDRLERENRPAVMALAFSPDGKTLAACGTDDNIRCWEVASGKLKHCIRLTPAGDPEKRFASDVSTSVGLVDMAPPWLVFSCDGKTLVTSFTIAPPATDVLSCIDVIKQWDLATGKEQRQIRGEKDEVLGIFPDAIGSFMGIGIRNDRFRCWDLSTGKKRFTWQMRKEVQGCIAHWHCRSFSTYAQVIVLETPLSSGLQGFGKNLACHEASKGTLLCDIQTMFDVIPPALSPNGRTLATGDYAQGDIELWDTQSGQKRYPPDRDSEPEPPPAPPPAAKGGVTSLAFSPDGKMLAIAGSRGTISLWEAATAKERSPFKGHSGAIHTLAFSPNGHLLASGGKDGTVLLWDLKPIPSTECSPVATLSSEQLQPLWDQLADKDAARAYRAIWRMSTVPQQAVPFVKQRLPLLSDSDYQRIQRLLADLDSDQFAVRDEAERDLRRQGGSALPVLARALEQNPPLELRCRAEALVENIQKSQSRIFTPDRLRYLRTVEMLEDCGTAEAKDFLRLLIERASDPCLWQEAKEASWRLASRATGTR